MLFTTCICHTENEINELSQQDRLLFREWKKHSFQRKLTTIHLQVISMIRVSPRIPCVTFMTSSTTCIIRFFTCTITITAMANDGTIINAAV